MKQGSLWLLTPTENVSPIKDLAIQQLERTGNEGADFWGHHRTLTRDPIMLYCSDMDCSMHIMCCFICYNVVDVANYVLVYL